MRLLLISFLFTISANYSGNPYYYFGLEQKLIQFIGITSPQQIIENVSDFFTFSFWLQLDKEILLSLIIFNSVIFLLHYLLFYILYLVFYTLTPSGLRNYNRVAFLNCFNTALIYAFIGMKTGLNDSIFISNNSSLGYSSIFIIIYSMIFLLFYILAYELIIFFFPSLSVKHIKYKKNNINQCSNDELVEIKKNKENLESTYQYNKKIHKNSESELTFKNIVKQYVKYKKNKIKSTIQKNSNKRRRGSISQKIKDQVWNRDGGKCVQCGSQYHLEFDHIIPHSKGGANTYRNLQLLCEPCNRSKSNKIG